MSDENPFAEIKPETSIAYAEGFSVVVEGEELCPPWGNWAESEASGYAAKINTAVAARERKAAAKALREAARDFVGHRSGDDEWTADDVRAWLRSRAAALEGGAS